MCLVRWSERMKRRWQMGQPNFFSPVCVRLWRDSSSEREKRRSQPSQMHTNGFSPATQSASPPQSNTTHHRPLFLFLVRVLFLLFGTREETIDREYRCASSCALWGATTWNNLWRSRRTGTRRCAGACPVPFPSPPAAPAAFGFVPQNVPRSVFEPDLTYINLNLT